jgi:hypothetical protein
VKVWPEKNLQAKLAVYFAKAGISSVSFSLKFYFQIHLHVPLSVVVINYRDSLSRINNLAFTM